MTEPRVLISIGPPMYAELGAEISADGYSGSVANVCTGDVLAALDRAEQLLMP